VRGTRISFFLGQKVSFKETFAIFAAARQAPEPQLKT
jgi:hypothetical protein